MHACTLSPLQTNAKLFNKFHNSQEMRPLIFVINDMFSKIISIINEQLKYNMYEKQVFEYIFYFIDL